MTNFRTVVLAGLLGLSAGVVFAQPDGVGRGPGAGAGAGPMGAGPLGAGPMQAGPAASAPGMGMGMGPGGGAARWGSDATPGWTLMTPQERQAHGKRMRAMTTYAECRAYQDKHHAEMAARAKRLGGTPLSQPRRDACGGLKK